MFLPTFFFQISFHLVKKKHHPYNEQKETQIPRCHGLLTASIWMRRKTVQNSLMYANVTVELASKPWLVKLSLWYLFTRVEYKPVFYRLSKKDLVLICISLFDIMNVHLIQSNIYRLDLNLLFFSKYCFLCLYFFFIWKQNILRTQ